MKKILLIYLLMFLNITIIYPETVTEQSISLTLGLKEEKNEKKESKIKEVSESLKEKEADTIQLAAIYFENDEIEKAITELKKIEEKDRGFKYFYISGKINKKKNNYEEAVKNLRKAEEIQYENIELKIVLYEIYSENGGYEKEREKKKKEILESGISAEEKEMFKKVTNKNEKKYKVEYMGEVYTGGLFDSNVYNEKNSKKSDGGIIIGAMGGAVIKKGELKKIYLAAAYRNKIYFTESSESTHDFILAGEPVQKYGKWNISIPTAFNFALKDSEVEESKFMSGLKGNRRIGKNSEFTTGADFGYKNNNLSNYRGIEMYQYISAKWKSRYKINYEAEIKLKEEIYDNDNYDNIGTELKLNSTRVIKEKYKLSARYGIDFISYLEKEAGKKKNQTTDKINIEFESPFIKDGWRYAAGYIYEFRDSNISSYNYSKNEIYLKVKKEF